MQPLWAVHIRWDCKRGLGSGEIFFSDHEVILDAENPGQAQQKAMDWLKHNHPCAEVPSIPMRITAVKEIEQLRVYNDARIPAKV